MQVTYNWLKDFVEIKIPPQSLADKLTQAGLEVTSLEKKEGDFVFEIEVTANRADCLSVIGIAREVAAITGKKLKLPMGSGYPVIRLSGYPDLAIKIQDKKDCQLYTAKIIKDVLVGPSPDWLKKRLELIGCRSVNNVVDITNYILFEWGEPLHAFDWDKLSGNMVMVRRGKLGEKITTLDAEQRMLGPDILIIADREKPVAIAGVMGGVDSEVSKNTKNILLEAAVFNPTLVRRMRQKLGLQSESAYRFERGIDLETVPVASLQAVKLIQEMAGGRCILAKVQGLVKVKKRKINLDTPSVNKVLGISITLPEIKSILKRLEFKVKAVSTKNNFTVEVPAHRLDINLEIDLIEEIARIYGYERIPKTSPKVSPQITFPEKRDLVSLIKNILVGLGLNEVITYSLGNKAAWKILETEQSPSLIEILNPLSKEQEILRPTLIPSLIRCISSNLNQKQNYIPIFEIAKAFSVVSGRPEEELMLGMAICGAKSLMTVQGLIREEVGILHLKGILEILFERLGIKDYNFSPTDNPSKIRVCVNKQNLGLMGILKARALEKFAIKNKDVGIVELALDKLLSYARLKNKFVPLPIYPGITRDISLILPEDIKAEDILGAIRQRAGSLLGELRLTDYYQGKQIPPGFKGLTVSCLYRSDEHTLTEAEIKPLHTSVCEILMARFAAKIREG